VEPEDSAEDPVSADPDLEKDLDRAEMGRDPVPGLVEVIAS
jgi:hypothetical protein